MTFEDYLDQQKEIQSKMKLTKEDVWGKFDEDTLKRINNGMVVARSKEKCPVFNDTIPYKSVTVECSPEDENEVWYWLSYVQGSGGISKRKVLDNGNIALRSDYTCW